MCATQLPAGEDADGLILMDRSVECGYALGIWGIPHSVQRQATAQVDWCT